MLAWRAGGAPVLCFDGDAAGRRAADRALDVSRGSLMASPQSPPTVNSVAQATLCWFDPEPLRTGQPYALKLGTRTVKAQVLDIESCLDMDTLAYVPAGTTLQTNDIARATLLFQEPLAFDPYTRSRSTGSFILIDEATNATVAAGMIQEPPKPGPGMDEAEYII